MAFVKFLFTGCRYNGNEDLIDLYLNGAARPDGEKHTGSVGLTNSNFSATVELGHYEVGRWWNHGTMAMDELLIWEEQLPCDDVIRLFYSYP